jgi:mRNA interferase RelE/StbE
MSRLEVQIPPVVADFVRHCHPDLRQSLKEALRALAADPSLGEPLKAELAGFWKYRVRRFRIVYELDHKARLLRVLAIGHRGSVYERLAESRRRRE